MRRKFSLKLVESNWWCNRMALNPYHTAIFIRDTSDSLTNLFLLQIKFNICILSSKYWMCVCVFVCACGSERAYGYTAHNTSNAQLERQTDFVCTWHCWLHFAMNAKLFLVFVIFTSICNKSFMSFIAVDLMNYVDC